MPRRSWILHHPLLQEQGFRETAAVRPLGRHNPWSDTRPQTRRLRTSTQPTQHGGQARHRGRTRPCCVITAERTGAHPPRKAKLVLSLQGLVFYNYSHT